MADRRDRDRDRDRDRKRDRDDRDRDRDKDRDRDRDRDRSRHRHLDNDRDRERDRDRKDRERDRTRHTRSRTRSPDHRRSRSRSTDRHRSSRRSHHRTPSPEHSRKRRKHGDDDSQRPVAVISEFVDGIVKEKQQKKNSKGDETVENDADGLMDENEIEMMKLMGIPVGFDSTKGKPVEGNDVGGVRAVTKRQPRQYMNRRGGFNRPLPAEVNR